MLEKFRQRYVYNSPPSEGCPTGGVVKAPDRSILKPDHPCPSEGGECSQSAGCGSATISKEDIFYYVYGILHSPSYRERFSADLKKQLPRIPMVKDFWTFSEAGRKLAALHVNYESGEMYPLVEVRGEGREARGVEERGEGCGARGEFFTHPSSLTSRLSPLTQMRFPSKTDKSRIIYNSQLTLSGIPAEAYRYVVNGKSAIEWVMERYAVKTDKDSGIVNDPNDWCREQGNERYIVDLIKRVVHLSVESVKIIDGLPVVEG